MTLAERRHMKIHKHKEMAELANEEGKEPLTKEIGIQVKSSTFISLQRKAVTLSSSTQTPNLETDDTYEAALLRGGTLNNLQSRNESLRIKFYLNMKERERSDMLLSARFENMTSSNADDMLLDGMQSVDMIVKRGEQEKTIPKTAKVMPIVGGKPVEMHQEQTPAKDIQNQMVSSKSIAKLAMQQAQPVHESELTLESVNSLSPTDAEVATISTVRSSTLYPVTTEVTSILTVSHKPAAIRIFLPKQVKILYKRSLHRTMSISAFRAPVCGDEILTREKKCQSNTDSNKNKTNITNSVELLKKQTDHKSQESVVVPELLKKDQSPKPASKAVKDEDQSGKEKNPKVSNSSEKLISNQNNTIVNNSGSKDKVKLPTQTNDPSISQSLKIDKDKLSLIPEQSKSDVVGTANTKDVVGTENAKDITRKSHQDTYKKTNIIASVAKKNKPEKSRHSQEVIDLTKETTASTQDKNELPHKNKQLTLPNDNKNSSFQTEDVHLKNKEIHKNTASYDSNRRSTMNSAGCTMESLSIGIAKTDNCAKSKQLPLKDSEVTKKHIQLTTSSPSNNLISVQINNPTDNVIKETGSIDRGTKIHSKDEGLKKEVKNNPKTTTPNCNSAAVKPSQIEVKISSNRVSKSEEQLPTGTKRSKLTRPTIKDYEPTTTKLREKPDDKTRFPASEKCKVHQEMSKGCLNNQVHTSTKITSTSKRDVTNSIKQQPLNDKQLLKETVGPKQQLKERSRQSDKNKKSNSKKAPPASSGITQTRRKPPEDRFKEASTSKNKRTSPERKRKFHERERTPIRYRRTGRTDNDWAAKRRKWDRQERESYFRRKPNFQGNSPTENVRSTRSRNGTFSNRSDSNRSISPQRTYMSTSRTESLMSGNFNGMGRPESSQCFTPSPFANPSINMMAQNTQMPVSHFEQWPGTCQSRPLPNMFDQMAKPFTPDPVSSLINDRPMPLTNSLSHPYGVPPQNDDYTGTHLKEYYIAQFTKILQLKGLGLSYPNGTWMYFGKTVEFMRSSISYPVRISTSDGRFLDVQEVVEAFAHEICPDNARFICERLGISRQDWEHWKEVMSQNRLQ